jgi:uncharacterized protein (TIGR02266 family)
MSDAERARRPVRVPFVRACLVLRAQREPFRAFIANISTVGSYLASEESMQVGHTLRLRFTVPGNVIESEAVAVVAWLNPKQQHPVHSLPAGFGVHFLGLDVDTRRRIEGVVREYLERNPEP